MRNTSRWCAAFAMFVAACSGKSSPGALGSNGHGGANGAGASFGSSAGGANGSGASNATGNGSSFCIVGSLGCPCDDNLCGASLICANDTCCDATGNCTAPPPNSTGTAAPTGGAGGTTGAGPHMGPAKPGPGSAGASTSAVPDGGPCAPGVVGPVITDCGYPYPSVKPLTSVTFNEDEVLRAIVPSGGSPLASIRVFYNDEHALTLGVRSVVVGGTSTDYPVSPLLTDPASVRYPQTGTNLLTGNQSGLDPSARPMWPSLFVTDITDDPTDRSGDWQQGGTPWNPNVIFGSWKAAVRTVDGSTVSITPDADPAKNDWNLPGGDTVPSGLKNEGFGAEARWDLVLVAGRSYRIQVMVHDGDQNKVGGDSGEACVDFCADAACPEGSDPCVPGERCTRERSCFNGCCL